ncbi:hypothetical protein HID58_002016, partial [Brassica napus]
GFKDQSFYVSLRLVLIIETCCIAPRWIKPVLGSCLMHTGKGVILYGSYWEHVLSYWNGSLEDKENIIEEPHLQVKRLIEFLNNTFTEEEAAREPVEAVPAFGCANAPEKCFMAQGWAWVEEIVNLYSLSNLRSLEINKMGR